MSDKMRESFCIWRLDFESDYDRKPSPLDIWQAATLAERERAVKACENEKVQAELTQHPSDLAYNQAIKDCADAIRKGE